MNLVALQFKTTSDLDKNLNTLTALISKTQENSFVLAPELCLSGFDYENLENAVKISQKAIKILLELSSKYTISLTLLIKKDDKYLNTFHMFYNEKIVYTQSKAKLFPVNYEKKYFTSANTKDIQIFSLNGLKIAVLICFELRFVELWKQIQGADIILIPAMWGKLRKDNFATLSKALGIINQCYVLASNSADDNMAKSSGIVTPFGVEYRDDEKNVIEHTFDSYEIKKMRKYLNIGLKKDIKC